MPIRSPESYVDKAHYAEKGHNAVFVKKVNDAAVAIYDFGLLNPGGNLQEKTANSVTVIKNLGLDADSYQELFETTRDANKTERVKQLAQENIDALAKGIFWVMKEGGNSRLADLLGKGSAVDIDTMLPPPLKGIGGRVRANIIENADILSILNDLDDVRSNCDLTKQSDKITLAEEIDTARKDLIRLRGLDPNGKAELGMVKAYLYDELTELLGGGTRGATAPSTVQTGIAEGLDVIPPFVDPKSAFARSQMRASERLRLPEVGVDVRDKAATTAWIQKIIVDNMQSNPLGFAQWWQSGLCTQLDSIVSNKIEVTDFGDGDALQIEDRKQQLREYYRKANYASAAAIGYLQMLANSDQALPNLKSWAPPAEMADAFKWSKDTADFLKNEPLTAMCYKRIFNMAYEKKDEFKDKGWKVVEADSLKNGDLTNTNKFCNEMVAEIMRKDDGRAWKAYAEKFDLDPNNNQALWNAARVAIDMFWVENGAEYINYLNKTRRWEKTNNVAEADRKYKWFVYEPGEIGVKPRAVALEYREPVKTGEQKKEIKKMQWSHPLVIYPGDVWIIKGAYTPKIRRKAETAFMPFVDLVFTTKEDGERSFKAQSELHQKNPGRYNDFVDKLTGGPQLLEFDTIGGKDFPEAVSLARNLWGSNPVSLGDLANNPEQSQRLLDALKSNKIDKAGDLEIDNGTLKYKKGKELLDFEVFLNDTESTLDVVENDLGILTLSRAMSQVFDAKADALFSGNYKSEAAQIVLGLIKLDRYSGQAELDYALRELVGKELRGNAGFLRDMDRSFGIVITAYQGARDGVIRMMMGEPDVQRAYDEFNAARLVLGLKVFGAAVGGSGGGKKR